MSAASVTLQASDWNYVVGILALRGEQGSQVARVTADRIHAQLHGTEKKIQTVESPGPVPVSLHVAMVAAYDAERMTLTDDPARLAAVATETWEWLATGNTPAVNVLRADAAESDE